MALNQPWLMRLHGLSIACEAKGHWFDSQSAHMLGCGPGPQYGACERQPHTDVYLSPSLPLSLKLNKTIKINVLKSNETCASLFM